MLRKRERAVFPSEKLRTYAEKYHAERADRAMDPATVSTSAQTSLGDLGRSLSRSESVIFDTKTQFSNGTD